MKLQTSTKISQNFNGELFKVTVLPCKYVFVHYNDLKETKPSEKQPGAKLYLRLSLDVDKRLNKSLFTCGLPG